MPSHYKKKVKVNVHQCDTSRCKKISAYSKPKDLDVESSIKKDKEVKEKDVFDFKHKKKDNNIRK